MTDLTTMTRDDLNAHAADAGIADPDKLPNKDAVIAALDAQGVDVVVPAEPASDDQAAAIRAHLADPNRNPLPTGVHINFGDPVPFGQDDDAAAS